MKFVRSSASLKVHISEKIKQQEFNLFLLKFDLLKM